MTARTTKAAGKTSPKTRRSSAASKRRGKAAGKPSLAREIWLITWGIIGILAGLLFTGVCGGFWYGSGEIVKIIEEINERDFTVMTEREKVYDEFFNTRDNQGYRINKEPKQILLGKVTYMWRVQPPGSSEIREFGWEHDLETNTVHQTTNGALLLDIDLGLINEEYARTHDPSIPREYFNPDDSITFGIVTGDMNQITQGNLARGWDDESSQDRGVLPPLLTPEQAGGRKALQEEEHAAATAGENPCAEEEPMESTEDVVDIVPADNG